MAGPKEVTYIAQGKSSSPKPCGTFCSCRDILKECTMTYDSKQEGEKP